MMLSITNYIASAVETWNMSMEHWYNDTDRQNRSKRRNNCPSVTLSTTTEKDNRRACYVLRCMTRHITESSTYISLPYQQSAIFVKTIHIWEPFSLQELYKRYFVIREELENDISIGTKHKLPFLMLN